MVYQGNSAKGHSAVRLDRRAVLAGLGSAGLVACQPMPVTQHSQDGVWRTGESLPLAVQEIYPALHGGRVHVAGGFVAENGTIIGPTDRHFACDPAKGVWSEQTPLPTPRHHPHLVSFQEHLLAFGGFESLSGDRVWAMQAGGWMLDEDAGNWGNLAALAHPVGEAVTGVLEGRLHIAGGRKPSGSANANWGDHTDTSEHFVLTSLAGNWETAAPLPTPRNSAASGIIDGAWHVVGGRTVAGGNTNAHGVYDAREDRWRTAAPMPQGQGGLAAASLGGRLYAFGGEFFQPQPGGVYAEAWCYIPALDVWQAIPDMPSPRHGLGAVAIGDDIHVIGGALGVGGRETSALVEVFTPN
jgi:hypothetical protein